MSPWPTVKDHCPRLATFSWGLRAILMAYCLESKTSQDPGGTKLSMWWTWQPQTPECPTTGKGCRQRPSDAFSHSGMFASKPQKPRNHFHLAGLSLVWCAACGLSALCHPCSLGRRKCICYNCLWTEVGLIYAAALFGFPPLVWSTLSLGVEQRFYSIVALLCLNLTYAFWVCWWKDGVCWDDCRQIPAPGQRQPPVSISWGLFVFVSMW
jgi:hypothetical protein